MDTRRCTRTHADAFGRTRTHTDTRRRTQTHADECRENHVQCGGGRNPKTRPDTRRLFKDFRDVLYIHDYRAKQDPAAIYSTVKSASASLGLRYSISTKVDMYFKVLIELVHSTCRNSAETQYYGPVVSHIHAPVLQP